MIKRSTSSREAADWIAARNGKGETGDQLIKRHLAEMASDKTPYTPYPYDRDCIRLTDIHRAVDMIDQGKEPHPWIPFHLSECPECRTTFESAFKSQR